MGIRAKGVSWWVFALLSVVSLAVQASDFRLVEAAKNRDSAAVRTILRQGVDVNARDPDGSTALLWAAHWNDLDTAERLIRARADVNVANQYGDTPLWEACNNGSVAMVEKLVRAGANPNTSLLETGETALMTCARSTGNPAAVQLLLAQGADVNAKEKQKEQTALMWALERRHPEVARALIEHGADVRAKSKSGFTPLLFAARQGNVESARLLVERGVDVNEKAPGGLTPLLVAADSGQEAFAIFLAEKGADVKAADPNGLTALHYAVRKGHTILMYWQNRGEPGDAYRFRSNMPELVKVLLEHGADPNARIKKGNRLNPESAGARPQLGLAGATPFFLAAATGDVGIMRALLAKGADPDLITQDRTTPLMVAAGFGRKDPRKKEDERQALEAVKLLVELGADVNAINSEGRTALHGAASVWADEIIEFLVAKGANLVVEDKYGQTPLSIAEGDPNDFVDSSEKSARASPTSSTAQLIRKLGGDRLAQDR